MNRDPKQDTVVNRLLLVAVAHLRRGKMQGKNGCAELWSKTFLEVHCRASGSEMPHWPNRTSIDPLHVNFDTDSLSPTTPEALQPKSLLSTC